LLRVKEIAESKGYNILRLSRESGVHYSTVLQYWHNRLRRVDFEVLQKLARALNVTVKDLIADEPVE
jgi:transcriptional regulator with XRE-family HTH domain